MADRDVELPEKLKNDAIVEAILEIRFDMKSLPEVLIGRLASYPPWKNLQQGRMPAYNLPPAIREGDQNLRFQPIFELSTKGLRAIRIGPHVLSLHIMPPYMGWNKFQTELNEAIEQLFSNTEELSVRRLGLRYTNALSPQAHMIRSIDDLDIDLKIAKENAPSNVNLNFMTEPASNLLCTVRVASIGFVQGTLPESTSIVIDVDVFTKDGFNSKSMEEVKAWIVTAHDKLKKEFFRLMPEAVIRELKER